MQHTFVQRKGDSGQQVSKTKFIELNEVVKSFNEGDRKREVIRGINMTVTRGEIIVLLGRSGSGKSTILNLLGGMDTPDSGSIIIDNHSIHAMMEKQRTMFRRKYLGFVFQFFNLISTLTVEENLLLPLELNNSLTDQSVPHIQRLLEQVDMADRMNSYPDKLSGGEQQRIAIARALVHDPPLILADEPTGNLDAHRSEKVLTLLHNLTRNSHKTLIMATHSPEVAELADRVFDVREGHLHLESKEGTA
ncbi:MAG TPA: ABC transporter ATP-binding protein [Balneolaceae bacterium]|nr:ABC transporter ATP-binding protein [Balneolaceae bacterium]